MGYKTRAVTYTDSADAQEKILAALAEELSDFGFTVSEENELPTLTDANGLGLVFDFAYSTSYFYAGLKNNNYTTDTKASSVNGRVSFSQKTQGDTITIKLLISKNKKSCAFNIGAPSGTTAALLPFVYTINDSGKATMYAISSTSYEYCIDSDIDTIHGISMSATQCGSTSNPVALISLYKLPDIYNGGVFEDMYMVHSCTQLVDGALPVASGQRIFYVFKLAQTLLWGMEVESED